MAANLADVPARQAQHEQLDARDDGVGNVRGGEEEEARRLDGAVRLAHGEEGLQAADARPEELQAVGEGHDVCAAVLF